MRDAAAPCPDGPTPSRQLLEALPALQRLEEELAARLTPAMTGTDQPDGYTTPPG
jgi:hypothetical protein